MKFMISERFKNIDLVQKIECPILFIHGQKDDIVPFSHSIDLSKACKCPYELILPEEMDHNEINIYDDFLEPLSCFLQRHSLLKMKEEEKKLVDKSLFDLPDYLKDWGEYKKKKDKDYISLYLRRMFKI